jgi:dTMP kinase
MSKTKYPVIIFEGIEASGKSTNINNFSKYLKQNNYKFIKIREPGGSKVSEKLRKLMLNKNSNLNAKTDLLLVMASRSENIDKILNKHYQKKIILIDRFTDSTIAYQHYGMGINLKIIKSLNTFVVGKFKPNLTFLCTVNKKNMFKRLSSRSRTNRYDNFKFKFYDKVRKGFEKLSKNKTNYVLLESDKSSQKENLNKIIKAFKKIIN